VDPAVTPEISRAIARCMAREAADRFQTAGELEAELQRLLVEGTSSEAFPATGVETVSVAAKPRRIARYAPWLLAAAVAIGALVSSPLVNRFKTVNAARTGRPVIAVMPLENLSNDPSKAYLGIGVADSFTISLARLSSISVVSRPNMLDAGASKRPFAEIARNLGVTLLLGGSIQPVGDLLRVNATLTDLKHGQLLWSGFEEGRDDQLLEMQRRLAESLLNALRISLTPDERRTLERRLTEDVEARDAYWMGLALLDRPDDSDIDTAVAHFTRATVRDSRFSLAFAALGEAYRRRSVKTNNKALMEDAIAAVKTALDIDAEQPEVRLSLAAVYRSTGRPTLAVEEVRRVLDKQPDNDAAHRLLGELLASAGQNSGALDELRTAADLRPNYWRNQQALGLFFYRNNRIPEAIEVFTRLVRLKPDDATPLQQLGAMYLIEGNLTRARENFELSNKITPNADSFTNLGTIAYASRQYEDAVREYQAAVNLAPTIAVHHGNLGDAYVKVGRADRARAAYLKAIEVGEEALEINPNDLTTLSRLGVYYAKVGNPKEAERHANHARRTNPNDPDVLYLRTVVLALIGQQDAAMRQLTEAIERGYLARLALEDEDLASLRMLPAFQRLAKTAKTR
jgi:tetratricopeptide (TPR) repeat protein